MQLLQTPTCRLMRNGRSAALAEAKVVVRHTSASSAVRDPLPAPHETLWPRGYLGDARAARISVGVDA
ncbi:hypothetical protein HEP87_07855 [Streptomyces sp. S1D4-11]|nr:hypothetical protein [Streptomyces sp. S1D4-11]QIY93992.1 hypothetical protein HEP87_07855 [Streptomyces sp. S1D4-11]